MLNIRLVATAVVLTLIAGSADAQVRSRAQRDQDRRVAQIPQCERPIGSLTIAESDSGPYDALELQPPQALIRVVIQRSGCFTLVDRSTASRSAIDRERALLTSGAAQRGSNLGNAQTRIADFILVAEVVSQNENAAGSNFGGNARGNLPSLGGGLGGGLGSLLGGGGQNTGGGGFTLGGGRRTQLAEANTVISIINVRTTETLAVAQGYAAKRDVDWNISASAAFGGFVGGGYENTEFGRILGQAFIDSYSQSVSQLQALGDILPAAELAPVAEDMPAQIQVAEARTPAPRRAPAAPAPSTAAFRVTQSSTLRNAPGGSVVSVLRSGATVFSTGEEDGDWIEVIDENDAAGWLQLDRLEIAN